MQNHNEVKMHSVDSTFVYCFLVFSYKSYGLKPPAPSRQLVPQKAETSTIQWLGNYECPWLPIGVFNTCYRPKTYTPKSVAIAACKGPLDCCFQITWYVYPRYPTKTWPFFSGKYCRSRKLLGTPPIGTSQPEIRLGPPTLQRLWLLGVCSILG